jgi:hypothetical protein
MKKILCIFMGFILCIFAQEDTLKTSVSLIKLDNHTLAANVTFHNVSNEPLRIYFIENPIFNTFQSMLYVTYSDGNIELFSEEPHPNGISVEESDFHLIDVNKSKTFTQKIEFIEPRYQGKPIELQWVYKNKITKWEGGKDTLDGVSKQLFDGKEIPYIWTGKIECSTKIR